MHKIRNIYLSFIIVFSEVIWSYYAIVMFTSIEWNRPAFFDLTWFLIAMVAGYALNKLISKIENAVIVFVSNISMMALLIIQNWRSVVPKGFWGFGIAVSAGISLIFIRSLVLVYSQPTRAKLLQHFEGNVVLYIVFATVFTYHNSANEIFHLFFIFSIINSLLGMIFTLQDTGYAEKQEDVKIIKVGHSTWFTGAAIVLFIIVPLLSLIFLLPSVNKGLYSAVMGLWDGLKNIGLLIGRFIYWLFSLLPESHIETLPNMPNEQTAITPEVAEETLISLPYAWIIGGLAIILILITIWFLSKMLVRKRHLNKIRPKKVMIARESWLKVLLGNLTRYLRYLKLKFIMLFPYYYHKPVYWYYQQILNWGKKNKIPKNPSETSQEYLIKIINKLPNNEKSFMHKDKPYNLEKLLIRLNKDYQASYYGDQENISGESIAEYRILLDYMKRIRILDVKGS